MSELPDPAKIAERVCGCGATPDGSEGDGTGDFIDEKGNVAWICLVCWCAENYGRGALETLEAKRQAKKKRGSNETD